MSASTEKMGQVTLQSSDGIDRVVGEQLAHSAPPSARALTRWTDRQVAERSVLIKNLLADLPDEGDEPIPISNVRLQPCSPQPPTTCALTRPAQVNDTVLTKVIEWCNHHRNDPQTDAAAADDADNRKRSTDIDEWDQKFMQVDQEMLFEIILAANYLDIKALLDVGCKTVANMIKGKTPDEIRKTFNIQNDFTPEEEEQIRRENEWAEDR